MQSNRSRFRLTIKGNAAQALLCCAHRGIVPIRCVDSDSERAFLDAHATVTQLNRWFVETTGQAPYPVGTLLFWSEVA